MAGRTRILLIVGGLACASLLSSGVAFAQAPMEAGAPAFGENWRVTLDLSGGLSVNGRGDLVFERAVGIDAHKVISGRGGDWGTLVMQGYVMGVNPIRGDNGPADTMFMYKIFNLNVSRFSRGLFNVRVGHFEVPFGLEHVVNTNGTLRDFMHGSNLGMKADWGAGVNGSWQSGEYEVTWSRGTGNAPFAESTSNVVAGRIGTPSDGNVVVGGSFYSGLDRRRVGADVMWYRGLYGVLGETAIGSDLGPGGADWRGVVNSLLELNRTTEDNRVLTYFQTRVSSHDGGGSWTTGVAGALGLRVAVDTHWSFDTEYSAGLRPSGSARGRVLRSQARYRF
jgi:hypothetical protein